MLEDFREIPVIDPLATVLALYEMLVHVFRGNAESLSEILREMTHALIDPWLALAGHLLTGTHYSDICRPPVQHE